MDLLRNVRYQWDRVAAWVLVVSGAAMLLVGWWGASRTAYPAEQLPYLLSGGAGGLFVLGVAVMLWCSADQRDEWRKLDDLERKLDRVLLPAAGQDAAAVGTDRT